MEETKTNCLMRVISSWVGDEFSSENKEDFVRAVWKEAGISLLEGTDVSSLASNEIGPKVAIRDLRPGDLVFYKLSDENPQEITHVGVCVGYNTMVDCPASNPVVAVRSVFSYGFEKIAQIRRPSSLQEEASVTVEFVGPSGSVKIPCKPSIEKDKIRVDLAPLCVSFGIDLEYTKERNLVTLRRKQ
jgi:NlpC/P60 family